jgi:DNA-binding HxlR family transcriptional regulator
MTNDSILLQSVPPRVEYRLTAKGLELVIAMADLLRWMCKWTSIKGAKLP